MREGWSFVIVATMHDVITAAISDVLSELNIGDMDFVVEHPADLAHGDYASNAAMVAAKEVSKNPRELAEEIAEKLNGQIEYVEQIDVAGPGFINFFLARDFFTEEVARASDRGDRWGHNDDWQDATVLVEYTDPNPFKEFHIGHLFTNAVGESISRLFVASGANVTRCNYQGDVGLHVAHAIYVRFRPSTHSLRPISATRTHSARPHIRRTKRHKKRSVSSIRKYTSAPIVT